MSRSFPRPQWILVDSRVALPVSTDTKSVRDKLVYLWFLVVFVPCAAAAAARHAAASIPCFCYCLFALDVHVMAGNGIAAARAAPASCGCWQCGLSRPRGRPAWPGADRCWREPGRYRHPPGWLLPGPLARRKAEVPRCCRMQAGACSGRWQQRPACQQPKCSWHGTSPCPCRRASSLHGTCL